MSTVEEQPGPSRPSGSTGDEKEKDDRMFECNICLDMPKDAVVSLCGHLFWSGWAISYLLKFDISITRCC